MPKINFIKKEDEKLFLEISKAVAKLNIEKFDVDGNQIQFSQIDSYVIQNFHQLALLADPKATIKDRTIAFNLYIYLFDTKQNTTDYSAVKMIEKNFLTEFNQSAYHSLKTLANYFGYKKEEAVKKPLQLLSKMNLLIAKVYKSNQRLKYAFFVLKQPNFELCQKYPSDWIEYPQQQKNKKEPKVEEPKEQQSNIIPFKQKAN